MKTLGMLYSAFLVVFCLQTTFLILSTAHEVDLFFCIIDMLSVVIFLITVYSFYRFFASGKNKLGLQIFLISTVLIFGYYIYDIFNKGDATNIWTYQPILGAVAGLIILINISLSKIEKYQSRQ